MSPADTRALAPRKARVLLVEIEAIREGFIAYSEKVSRGARWLN